MDSNPQLDQSLQQYTQGRSPVIPGNATPAGAQMGDAMQVTTQNSAPSPDPQNAGQQFSDLVGSTNGAAPTVNTQR